ncbi:MAG: DinB family protein [Chloroflexi bacterium]|nr:DinB family protein [Chloroflexota bacterium]MCC6894868.1 DinB family protein [Anaerolineae bacterium]
MNADAFRQLFQYHFDENRKIWDTHIMSLSQEQFLKPDAYSVGSVRNQVVHMMSCDDYWFSGLRGLDMPDMPDPTPFEDRAAIRARWDGIEQNMKAYLAALTDDMLFTHPLPGGDRLLALWQILLHVTHHAVDHRAQLLKLLNSLGVETTYQDYIFYVFDHYDGGEPQP